MPGTGYIVGVSVPRRVLWWSWLCFAGLFSWLAFGPDLSLEACLMIIELWLALGTVTKTAPSWRGHCPILSPSVLLTSPCGAAPSWCSPDTVCPVLALAKAAFGHPCCLSVSVCRFWHSLLEMREQSHTKASTWVWTICLYNNIIVFSLVLKPFSNNS